MSHGKSHNHAVDRFGEWGAKLIPRSTPAALLELLIGLFMIALGVQVLVGEALSGAPLHQAAYATFALLVVSYGAYRYALGRARWDKRIQDSLDVLD